MSGRVINTVPGSSPSGGGNVNLYPRGSGLVDAAQDLHAFFSFKDGHFSIANVPPGSYYLDAGWFDRDSKEHFRARRPLDVGTSDLDGVTVTITRGTDIHGSITWEGSPVGDSQELMVRLRPLEEDELGSPPPTVKSDGTFVFKSVPEGTYRPFVSMWQSSGNFFLKSASYGTTSVSDAGFTVQPSSDLMLELTLSSRASQLNGAVLNSESLPASGVTVVLIPDPPHRNIKENYKFATTDQNGKFSLQGITPGDYKLFSWDSDQADPLDADWFDAAWLKPYETKGESVHLEESDNKSVNLTLIETRADSAAN